MPFEQDDSGGWWYRYASQRERAELALCERCDREFPRRRHANSQGLSQRFCSKECADLSRSTERTAGPGYNGAVSTRASFRQDDDGQWWYHTKKQRSRAKVRVCIQCGGEFLAPADSRHKFCSRSCRRGPLSTRWKGGRRMIRGYVFVWNPDHPSLAGTKRRYVAEHRLVMEETLGRPLEPTERVHHLNGVKDDNRPDNLELWTIGHPAGQRMRDVPHCPSCTCAAHAE